MESRSLEPSFKSHSEGFNRPKNNSPLYTKHVSGHLRLYKFSNIFDHTRGKRGGMITDHNLENFIFEPFPKQVIVKYSKVIMCNVVMSSV